jgi:hypothetical protein
MLHYALSCFISLQLNFHRHRPGNYTPSKSESDSDAKNWCHRCNESLTAGLLSKDVRSSVTQHPNRQPNKLVKRHSTIKMSRPKDRCDRALGTLWRTGANEATTFVVTDDVVINGQKLAAGSYSLHTIPNKDDWTIVFNGTANQWGSFNYDPAKDTLRVRPPP